MQNANFFTFYFHCPTFEFYLSDSSNSKEKFSFYSQKFSPCKTMSTECQNIRLSPLNKKDPCGSLKSEKEAGTLNLLRFRYKFTFCIRRY